MPWKACLADIGFPAKEEQASHLVAAIDVLNCSHGLNSHKPLSNGISFRLIHQATPETLQSPRTEAEYLPPAIAYTHHFTLGL